MRQSHQKSRSRGRSRKPQNPMSRNYESNGPDVKIRGNAGHIAEKYSTLARDALSNGDTVMAENYLQHAEHYNRLIAAAQAQRAEENAANAAQAAANGRGPQPEVDENGNEVVKSSGNEAEANANSNGSDNSAQDDQNSEPRERKNSRGRRTKRVASEKPASDDAAENSADSSDGGEVEAVSDDAASLPQSITGDLRVEEA